MNEWDVAFVYKCDFGLITSYYCIYFVELDVVESDQRRTECLEKMADLEQQFYQLREQLVFSRLISVF